MTAARPARIDAAAALANRQIALVIRRHGGRADALIEVLHQVQQIHGYLPKSALQAVACGLQLPLSRVYGVASFYHLFRLQAPSPHRCAVCLGTACFVRHAGALVQQLEQRLGLELDAAGGAGSWTLEQVSCIGACGQAPVLLVDGGLETKLPVDDPQALAARFDALGLPRAQGGER